MTTQTRFNSIDKKVERAIIQLNRIEVWHLSNTNRDKLKEAQDQLADARVLLSELVGLMQAVEA